MICRIFRCHLALFAMKLNLYLPLRYFNHPELSAINLSLHWLTRHGCESVNTKWDSFTTFREYFNFSIVEMSVPRLMKYCPYQTNEVDRIFHISPLQTFPLLFPAAITSFIKLTHNSVPQLIFLSFFTSCLGGCLCFVYASVSLVIGAAADMSLVVIGVSPPRYWVSAASLSHCPQCCGQWRYLVCSGHAGEHLLSSRFKLENSYLKKQNNEYMFAELCDSIILTKH